MQELVTLEQAETVLIALAWGLPIAGVVIGAVVGGLRGAWRRGAGAGLAFGLTGPIVWTLWRVYRGLVRYDPETGEAGLHSVSTHALAALIFVAVGVVLGVIYRRMFDYVLGREEHEGPTTNDTAGD